MLMLIKRDVNRFQALSQKNAANLIILRYKGDMGDQMKAIDGPDTICKNYIFPRNYCMIHISN